MGNIIIYYIDLIMRTVYVAPSTRTLSPRLSFLTKHIHNNMGDAPTVGINGFGRIGRAVLREALSNSLVRVISINDPHVSAEYAAYLLLNETRSDKDRDLKVEVKEGAIVVNGQYITVFQKNDPVSIPWKVTYVVECSGMYTTQDRASGHLASGASRVVIASPSADAPTYIVGVNDSKFNPSLQVISAGSTTGTVLATALKPLNERFGVESCFFTAIHALTTGQKVIDGTSGKDWRAGRAAQNIIPFVSGAQKTLQKTLPALAPMVNGRSMHVPVPAGCVLEMVVRFGKPVTCADVDATMEELQADEALKGGIATTSAPIVSSDVLSSSTLCVFDKSSPLAVGDRSVQFTLFYDNERGYARRLLDLVLVTSTKW